MRNKLLHHTLQSHTHSCSVFPDYCLSMETSAWFCSGPFCHQWPTEVITCGPTQSTQCPPTIWRHWPKSTVTVRSQSLYREGLREASCTLLQVITAVAQDKSQKSVTVLSRLCRCFVCATQAYLLLMKKHREGHGGDKGKAGQRVCNFKSLQTYLRV